MEPCSRRAGGVRSTRLSSDETLFDETQVGLPSPPDSHVTSHQLHSLCLWNNRFVTARELKSPRRQLGCQEVITGGGSKPQGGITVPPGGVTSGHGHGCVSHLPHTAMGHQGVTACGPQPPARTPTPVSLPGHQAHLDVGSGYQGGGTIRLANTHGAQGLALHTPRVWFCRGPSQSKPFTCAGSARPPPHAWTRHGHLKEGGVLADGGPTTVDGPESCPPPPRLPSCRLGERGP